MVSNVKALHSETELLLSGNMSMVWIYIYLKSMVYHKYNTIYNPWYEYETIYDPWYIITLILVLVVVDLRSSCVSS